MPSTPVEALSGDVLNVLDQIGRPVVLIGASMGGLTSILVAHLAGPQKVTKLVLVDVVPRVEQKGSFSHPRLHGQPRARLRDPRARRRRHLRIPAAPQASEEPRRAQEESAPSRRPLVLALGPGVPDQPINDDPFVRAEELEQAAIDLTIPILLIRGKLSDVVSPEGVQDFLAKVPAAEFVELSDAGHTAAGDDNDAFSAAVVSFVTR